MAGFGGVGGEVVGWVAGVVVGALGIQVHLAVPGVDGAGGGGVGILGHGNTVPVGTSPVERLVAASLVVL